MSLNLNETPIFSSGRLLTGLLVEKASVEPDNVPIESDKRRSFEKDRERRFQGSGGGRELTAIENKTIKMKTKVVNKLERAYLSLLERFPTMR